MLPGSLTSETQLVTRPTRYKRSYTFPFAGLVHNSSHDRHALTKGGSAKAEPAEANLKKRACAPTRPSHEPKERHTIAAHASTPPPPQHPLNLTVSNSPVHAHFRIDFLVCQLKLYTSNTLCRLLCVLFPFMFCFCEGEGCHSGRPH